jgi:hypothetical protein
MPTLNWKPIEASATKAAEALGHKLEPFRKHRSRFGSSSNQGRMATCETCFGCCRVSYDGHRFGAEGRLLAFRCGTPEAAGIKVGPAVEGKTIPVLTR